MRSQGNDSFAALIDSNASASDHRPQDTSGPQPAPARRADDTPAATDNRSRDRSAASDKAAPNNSDGRDTANSGRIDAVGNDNTDPTGASKPKSATSKPDAAKSGTAKAEAKAAATLSSDETPPADPTETTPQAAPVLTVPNAIAVAISAAISSAASPAEAPPVSPLVVDKNPAPLAIAAAAIAATTAVAGSVTPGATALAGIDAPANADPIATPAITDAVRAAGVKADTPAAIANTLTSPGAAADVPAATTIALATATAVATPVAPKISATSKAPAGSKDANAIAVAPAADDGKPQPAATSNAVETTPADIAQPETIGDKPKSETAPVDVKTSDLAPPTPASAPAINPAAYTHSAAGNAGLTAVTAADTSAAAGGTIQPQLASPSVTTTPALAPIPQFNVIADSQAAVPLSGLAMEIAASAKSGNSRFEIRLDPADLGRIDVRIDVDRNGQVTSHLTVEKPETLSMLRQDATQLQRALDNAGLSTGNDGLQFSLRDQSSSGQNDRGQSNPNAQRLIVSEDETVPTAIVSRGYSRMLGASGGVDIRV